MTLERKISKIFNLKDENWIKHANPWSVWTRYSVLPIIVLAFWSRIWLGWWHLIPAIISLAWMFFNPVFFKKPKSTNNWASKSVLGERVYLNRDKIDIPKHHKLPPNILNAIWNDTSNLRYSNALCVASNIGNSSGLFREKLVFRQNGLVV